MMIVLYRESKENSVTQASVSVPTQGPFDLVWLSEAKKTVRTRKQTNSHRQAENQTEFPHSSPFDLFRVKEAFDN